MSGFDHAHGSLIYENALSGPECVKDLKFDLHLFFEIQPDHSRRIRLKEEEKWMPSDTCHRRSVG